MAIAIDLGGKTAIVTGGRKGIGYAIAEKLGEAGAHVAIVAREQRQSEEAAERLQARGIRCIARAQDVGCVEGVRQTVRSIEDQFGKVDILVNCAGVDARVPTLEATEENWRFVMDTNLKGAYFFSQAVGQGMVQRRSGRIVSIGSMLALVVKPNETIYSASKGGLVQMTRSLAAEWAKYNVTVNSVSPGSIPTDINRAFLANKENYDNNVRKVPMGRLGDTSEVANTVLFMVSDLASYITGQNLFVDGGWTLGW